MIPKHFSLYDEGTYLEFFSESSSHRHFLLFSDKGCRFVLDEIEGVEIALHILEGEARDETHDKDICEGDTFVIPCGDESRFRTLTEHLICDLTFKKE